MNSYVTVATAGEAVHVEKKSRFLALCSHVETEAEAAAIVEGLRKRHYDARHHCYAWVTGENGAQKRSSDDGEPSGTAGLPILEVITRRGLTNALVVVTRYFGGVLLGAPGLVRAYSAAAAMAIDSAELVTMHAAVTYLFELDYSRHSRFDALVAGVDGIVLSTDFGERVTIELAVRTEREEQFLKALDEFTNASVRPLELGRGYRAWPIS